MPPGKSGPAEVCSLVHEIQCGCTVSPGFDFADFEMASAARLTAAYPACHELISARCRLP